MQLTTHPQSKNEEAGVYLSTQTSRENMNKEEENQAVFTLLYTSLDVKNQS